MIDFQYAMVIFTKLNEEIIECESID